MQLQTTVFLALLALSSAHSFSEGVTERMAEFKAMKTTPFSGITPGQNHFQVQRPEGLRDYYVWVPNSYLKDPTEPADVIFAYHGLGDTCTDFGPATGFIDLTEANRFLFVYPCGSAGTLGNAWNAGTCCLAPTTVDDVEFTRDMVAALKANFTVNPNRIFVSGFSNGAMMAEVLACQANDILSGAAGVSGCVEMEPGNDVGERFCSTYYAANNRQIPVLHVHGDLDFVVPWTGDTLLGFPPTPTDFADWASRNNCTGTPVQTLNNGPYTNQVYQTCGSDATTELVRHSGGGHEWPVDQYFNTPEYILQFFKNIKN